jgi:hypothetical protein
MVETSATSSSSSSSSNSKKSSESKGTSSPPSSSSGITPTVKAPKDAAKKTAAVASANDTANITDSDDYMDTEAITAREAAKNAGVKKRTAAVDFSSNYGDFEKNGFEVVSVTPGQKTKKAKILAPGNENENVPAGRFARHAAAKRKRREAAAAINDV